MIDKKGTDAGGDEHENTNKPVFAARIGWLLMQRFTADVTNIRCDRIVSITPGALYDFVVHRRIPQRFGLAKFHSNILIDVSADGYLHDFKKKSIFQSF